jgi:hypothetical protein
MVNLTWIWKLLKLKGHKNIKFKMESIREVFINHNYHNGRMISGSKSFYREMNPDNVVYFNANIFTLEEGKIWYGDIDFTKDKNILTEISKEINRDLYILRELDGRFGNENINHKEIKSSSQQIIKC